MPRATGESVAAESRVTPSAVSALCVSLRDVGEDAGKHLDPGKMSSGQRFELVVSTAGELEVDQAVVDRVAIALEQPAGLGSLAEFDCAVVAYV